jgi:nicotinamidase-related amidase
MRPALLVIDVQNGWLDLSKGLKQSVNDRLERMAEAISIFRKGGAPVIFTYQLFPGKGIVPGTEAFELCPGIVAEGSDVKVVKSKMNAFNGTELERILRDRGCDAVVIIGLSSLQCVLATYYGAYDRDLSPYLVRDAVAGATEESVRIVEKICDTLSLGAVSQILGLEQSMMVGHGGGSAHEAGQHHRG